MFKDYFLAIDLELNQPSNTIIQLGWAIGNIKSGEIVETGSNIVYTTETINPEIVALTKITDEQIAQGVSLVDAYNTMMASCERWDCFINPITWGGGDSQLLKEQLPTDIVWKLGRRWIDAKTVYCSWRLAHFEEPAGGLAKALTKLGLAFQGRKHNAVDDAVNTFRIYRRLLDEFA
jgi:inhibitor of KinA sporulation pathway (predicted exonuclease)